MKLVRFQVLIAQQSHIYCLLVNTKSIFSIIIENYQSLKLYRSFHYSSYQSSLLQFIIIHNCQFTISSCFCSCVSHVYSFILLSHYSKLLSQSWVGRLIHVECERGSLQDLSDRIQVRGIWTHGVYQEHVCRKHLHRMQSKTG